jgi:hypothetical protein
MFGKGHPIDFTVVQSTIVNAEAPFARLMWFSNHHNFLGPRTPLKTAETLAFLLMWQGPT